MTDRSVAAVAELVQGHQPCVALTGAGVSTVNRTPDSGAT